MTAHGATRLGRILRSAWRFALLWLATGIAAAQSSPPPAPNNLNPDEFRAALLSKIPHYVGWPETALGPRDEEIVITLLGGGSFTNLLQPLLRDARIGARALVLRSVDTLENLPRCHVLFVPADRTEEFNALPEARRNGLLTVGEVPGFTRIGGVFVLSVADRKLTVNARNARGAHLELQSRLLRIATVER